MLIQYFKIAFRNMRKYKAQSLIGIFGLAFGLMCFIPAFYWLLYETSYDGFYPHADHIYRIYSFDKQTGKTNDLVSGILERELHEQFPTMQTSTVFFIEQNNCSVKDIPYVRLRTLFTDSTFLNVFPQTVISGTTWQPFQIANNMMLTESAAIRLFGDAEKAVGQPVKSTSFDESYTVVAVVKDPPVHTNLSFDAILSHEQIKLQKSFVDESGQAIWAFATLQMYAKFPPHTDVGRLEEQLRTYPSDKYENASVELRMVPISDVRHAVSKDGAFTLSFVHLFVIAGLLLLGCALFNFLSLHLDLFRQRLREFRLRSVHGASSAQLIRQMLFELTCAILLVLLFACFLVIAVCPLFSGLLNIEMGIPRVMLLFIVCGIGVIIIAWFTGFILFWRLSRLSLSFQAGKKSVGQPLLQRMVVTLQLIVSIVFIVATLVVMMQMRFVNHKDLGFDRNGIVYLSGLPPFLQEDVRVALKEKLTSIPQIEKITDTDFTPQHTVNPFKITTNVKWPGQQQSEKVAFNFIITDSQFEETFKVNMSEGMWLDEEERDKVVLNEEAVRAMELTEPIGTVIRIKLNEEKEYRVAGVVKDFHTLSFRSRIQPTLFVTSPYPANNLYVRVAPGREQEAIQRINAVLSTIDASFVDVHPVLLSELYDRLNDSEQAGLKMFSVLAVVCLLISLFGIYAVATAATQRRRKEIAIRKVAGAEAGSIVRLFFREYILQLIIAGAFAIPLAYLVMSRWLQGYAYRTNISGWLLAAVVTGVIAVVLLTVLGQVLRAANANPAKVVKSE